MLVIKVVAKAGPVSLLDNLLGAEVHVVELYQVPVEVIIILLRLAVVEAYILVLSTILQRWHLVRFYLTFIQL